MLIRLKNWMNRAVGGASVPASLRNDPRHATSEACASDPACGLLRRKDAAFVAVPGRGFVLDAEGAGNAGRKRRLRHRSPKFPSSLHLPKALLVLSLLLGFPSISLGDDPVPPEKLRVMVEALARMTREQIDANPKLQAALGRALQASRGTADFVRLVKALQIPGQCAGLIEVVQSDVAPEVAVDAIRMVLGAGSDPTLSKNLSQGPSPRTVRLVEALGNSLDRRAVPLLTAVLAQEGQDVAVRRACVRALIRTQDGATAVLASAREGTLADDLRFVAGTELGNVRWPTIKSEAARLFPPLAAQGASPLPPVAELLRLPGDAKDGAAVFRRDTVGCIKCHQINGDGVDFGPKLSEIGSKLGKDALYESVLDPSAGISFGFEAWQVNLKDGDEVFGLLVSETEEEIVMKAQGGVVTKHKKTDIASREKLKTSIMPAGLQAAMTAQELVDLVEYLSTLRTPGK